VTRTTLEPAEAAGVDTAETTWRLDGGTLDALAARLGADRQSIERLVVAGALATGVELDQFQLHAGGWYLDLPAATARALLNGAVLTGALAALHEASLPAAVLSLVIPLLFDVERVRLSESDRYVYALLRRKLFDRKSIDDWYAELPQRVRDEIGPLEFRNLAVRLKDARLVDLDLFDQLQLTDVSDRRLVRLELPPLDSQRPREER
jgi:hypothetical protein